MVQKHMILSMIAPVTVAGILIMTILAATVNAQESNSTENAQESNNTGNAQQETNATSTGMPENATSTGMPENATSSGMPENATSSGGSMENTTSGMESNNTGNAPESNSNMTVAAPSNMTTAAPNITENGQESNNTGNATSSGVPNLPSLENATSTGAPENATSPSGSTANNTASPSESMVNSSTRSTQQSNNTGNGPTSQASVPQSNSTGSVPQSNSTTSPIGSTANNNTLPVNTTHAYCDSCNNDIYYGKMDFANMVLAVHNRERAAVGVPPLAWNDTLAAGAKAWAEHLATTGKFEHSSSTDRQGAGENIAAGGHTTTVPIAQNMQGWVAEKNSYQGLPSATGTNVIGHYTQMVWRSTTTVGCGTATGGGRDVLVCRYSPAGNTGGPPY